jgi:glycosyltransferase involved in cell wall biosynthesis
VAVLPAYDCEGTVGGVIRGVLRHLERAIVVSDGSSDRTAQVAREAGAEVEELPVNRGKGAALQEGIRRALATGTRALLLLDADAQHDPEDIPAFLAVWDREAPDLLIGARLGDAHDIPPARFWTNYIGSRILSWMTGRELVDSQSGYRLVAAGLMRRLRLSSSGYAVESEMLIKAARLGANIQHVEVRTIYNDAGSHFRPILDTFRISCASVYYKVFDENS